MRGSADSNPADSNSEGGFASPLGPGIAHVRAASRLRGSLRVPGDKSITHRALILAALSGGETRVLGGSDGLDCDGTAAVLGGLGVGIERRGAPVGGQVDRVVRSPGRVGLGEPAATLDCGNSGTTLRLMAGVLASLPMRATLDGDDSLRRRPVARIIEPLRRMGAALHARADDTLPPLTVLGHTPLLGIDYRTPVPSAQVKSAILLAGLAAQGTVVVREAVATRDHTERMLRARGVRVARGVEAARGGGGEDCVVSMEGGQALRARDERVPGDVSAAAFWLVAGAAHADAELRLTEIGVNPTRRAVIDLLREMGASIEEHPLAPEAGAAETGPGDGEPIADLVVRSSRLRAIEIGPASVAAAIDEIPILCIAAACAAGTTHIRGAGELRNKESDRLEGVARGLAALGVTVELDGNDLTIHGRGGTAHPLRAAELQSHDDHRLAMAWAVAGLLADGLTALDGAASVPVSYPGFLEDLERVCA